MASPDLYRLRVDEAVAATQNLQDHELEGAALGAADAIVAPLSVSRKVLLCGNGGSAADAQHLAAEFVGRFALRRRSLPAIALADNIAALTAVANDFGYEDVFARAISGLGASGDVLIGLSTSGRSVNVVRAFEAARSQGITCVALVNDHDCPLALLADHVLAVGAPSTARAQECHKVLGHVILEIVEASLFG